MDKLKERMKCQEHVGRTISRLESARKRKNSTIPISLESLEEGEGHPRPLRKGAGRKGRRGWKSKRIWSGDESECQSAAGDSSRRATCEFWLVGTTSPRDRRTSSCVPLDVLRGWRGKDVIRLRAAWMSGCGGSGFGSGAWWLGRRSAGRSLAAKKLNYLLASHEFI